MARQYHYLIAGLPDILFDDNKVPISLVEFRDYLQEYLPIDDFRLMQLYFWQFDQANVLLKLEGQEKGIDTRGNLSEEELEALIDSIKDDSFASLEFFVPSYFEEFISAYKNEAPLFENKPWDLQFSELYFNYLSQSTNLFAKDWFDFELNLNNLQTALQCRSNELPVEGQLVGKSEMNEKLAKSSTRDFGLSDEILELDKILKASEETDLLQREKKIDLIRWELLDEQEFFHYFTIERIFSFLMKLSLAERWIGLDKETGQDLFDQLLKSLESSYEFPKEFSLN